MDLVCKSKIICFCFNLQQKCVGTACRKSGEYCANVQNRPTQILLPELLFKFMFAMHTRTLFPHKTQKITSKVQ